MMKILYRFLLTIAYRSLLVYWYLFRPSGGGAYVAVWNGGQILIVKNSYKSVWTFPAGGRKKNESMEETAVRELSEEVSIDVKQDQLALVDYFVSHSEYRTDRSTVFEIEFDERPEFTIDNTEVVDAKFVDFSELRDKRYALACIANQYVERKAAESLSQASAV